MTDRPAQPPDPTRRRFFRQFAGDVVSSVGQVMGAAQVLQQQSAEAARELLGTEAPAATNSASTARPEVDASTAGYRAPFRWDGDVCWVVDQRRLPDVLADLEVRGAADAVTAINDGAITGGAVVAQLAAVTLALVAGRSRESRAFARRATIRGAANALRTTRPGSAAVCFAIDRILAVLDTFDNESTGEDVEAAIRAEAETIIVEASADHGALAGHAQAALPFPAPAADAGGAAGTLVVLTTGSTGAMGGGTFGTALGALVTAHHDGRAISVLVAETRPLFEGSRVAAWELAQAGVPYVVVTDAAAAGCLARGEAGAVVVSADRIAANGDVIAGTGTYPITLAASAAGVPVIVVVATTAIDLLCATGAASQLEDGRPGPVLTAAGTRVAPEGAPVRNPRLDVTPASLVSAIVTEAGVLRHPFEAGLEAHVAEATARRVSAGMTALRAAREAS